MSEDKIKYQINIEKATTFYNPDEEVAVVYVPTMTGSFYRISDDPILGLELDIVSVEQKDMMIDQFFEFFSEEE